MAPRPGCGYHVGLVHGPASPRWHLTASSPLPLGMAALTGAGMALLGACWTVIRRVRAGGGRAPRHLRPDSPVYWFGMQIGMIVVGFFTAWPVNVWLIRSGVREAM